MRMKSQVRSSGKQILGEREQLEQSPGGGAVTDVFRGHQ